MSFLDKGLGIGRLGQMGRYCDDFAACLARNLRRRRFERLLATCADCDVGTLPSQGKGYRLADTGARSGDKRRFPIHLEIHDDSRRLGDYTRWLYSGRIPSNSGVRVWANSSTASTSLSPSPSPRAIDSANMP